MWLMNLGLNLGREKGGLMSDSHRKSGIKGSKGIPLNLTEEVVEELVCIKKLSPIPDDFIIW